LEAILDKTCLIKSKEKTKIQRKKQSKPKFTSNDFIKKDYFCTKLIIMATISLKGNPINTKNDLPAIGSQMHAFELVASDLSTKSLQDFAGKNIILNIFPSIDTGTCATSVRTFNEKAAQIENTVVICVSKDLPFAMNRFCGAEGIQNVATLSAFRSNDFDYLNMTDGPLKGLTSRVIIVVNQEGKIVHHEQVSDIVNEPNYETALASI
jgi:thiol peroxidase